MLGTPLLPPSPNASHHLARPLVAGAFLTVFEHVMLARSTPEDQWSYILVPLLMGKAHPAYTALSVAGLALYITLKDAVLWRYDINSKTYRQRLRQAEL